ncbi:MAG: tyrosine-type recombinase/integrase [Terracidiphilus sp.]|jgi:integrase
MGRKRRSRRFQHGSLCESPDGKRWIVKFYYAPGKQTTKTLGSKSQINRKQAEMMREELVKPLNQSPFRSLGDDTFQSFVEDVFLPMKRESGEWRENTEKESSREIRLHLIPELGEVQFCELTPALLRALLKKKAEQGLRRETLNHLKGYLTEISKRAVAEGYLQNNISEGLKAPVKLARQSAAKLTVGLEQYAAAWNRLDERERLCFDLVMFAGMRESEVFALWCGNIGEEGIEIERSWYKGRYEPPKTEKSQRTVGVPDEIMERLKFWIARLPVHGPTDCVFPSTTLVTPIWPESVLRNYVRPKLRPAGLGWINFAIIRRSHSTLHKQRNSDLKIIADQQGHGMRTHLDKYVQSGVAERKAEAAKLYADFTGVLHKQG